MRSEKNLFSFYGPALILNLPSSSHNHHYSVMFSSVPLRSFSLYLLSWRPLILLPLCSAVMMFWRCGPHPSLCEQTMWTRRCASAQAQPGMFQYSGALGWEGLHSHSAAQPPVPWSHLLVLWLLSLPPRHSFIFLSLTQFLPRPSSFVSPANKLSLFVWCATECLNVFSFRFVVYFFLSTTDFEFSSVSWWKLWLHLYHDLLLIEGWQCIWL